MEHTLAPSAPDGPDARRRIRSLDVVRGAVMVLMALDHVRLYVSHAKFDPTDLSQTTVAMFLTRWVTHFCAPAFVFLAGTGAFLYAARVGSRAAASRYLLVRGLWLVVIELTVVRMGWTFNVDYGTYIFAGVIWMIGWCMVLMAGLVWLPQWAVGAFGVAIIAGHDGLLAFTRSQGPPTGPPAAGAWIWQILYQGGMIRLGSPRPLMFVLFTIIPWVGVMAAGYAFGAVMRMEPPRRTRWCLGLGLGGVAAFLLLRGLNLYGDPRPWRPQGAAVFSVLSFMNTSKYPGSLLFVLMTLGPTIAWIPALERARGVWDRCLQPLAVFGRVPFLYYVLHLPTIHLAVVGIYVARYGEFGAWLRGNFPVMPGRPPDGWGHGLIGVYLLTGVVVVALYWPCRWFSRLKDRSRAAWLSLV